MSRVLHTRMENGSLWCPHVSGKAFQLATISWIHSCFSLAGPSSHHTYPHVSFTSLQHGLANHLLVSEASGSGSRSRFRFASQHIHTHPIPPPKKSSSSISCACSCVPDGQASESLLSFAVTQATMKTLPLSVGRFVGTSTNHPHV